MHSQIESIVSIAVHVGHLIRTGQSGLGLFIHLSVYDVHTEGRGQVQVDACGRFEWG